MDDLTLLLAQQADELAAYRSATPDYWEGVYDRARDAWDAFALAELGTSTPSPVDLRGRPELAALWEALR
jgi:hypothetical protein